MTDDVKTVAQKILDRTSDQIGTHSVNCHEYHLACFAAFVVREMEAATASPAVDREALAQVIIDEAWAGSDPHEMADAIVASGLLRDVRDVQAEALEGAADHIEKLRALEESVPAENATQEAMRSHLITEFEALRDHFIEGAQAIREARNEH